MFLLMGLRLTEGIDPGRYAALGGPAARHPADRLAGRPRLRRDHSRGPPAGDALGISVLDAVVADLAA